MFDPCIRARLFLASLGMLFGLGLLLVGVMVDACVQCDFDSF